jgi:hypothetical protein
MPWVGFEHRITAFEGAKTFHVLHHAATVIGPKFEHRKFIENVIKKLSNDSAMYMSNWRWLTCVRPVWTMACYLSRIFPLDFSDQNTRLYFSSPNAYYTTIQRKSLSSGVDSVSTFYSGGHGFVSQLEYWRSLIGVFLVVPSYHMKILS